MSDQPRYSADETVQRAEDLYNQRLRQQFEAKHRGQYIAIDIESGEYEVGDDYHAAARMILARKPAAAIGVLRIGYSAVGCMGGQKVVAGKGGKRNEAEEILGLQPTQTSKT